MQAKQSVNVSRKPCKPKSCSDDAPHVSCPSARVRPANVNPLGPARLTAATDVVPEPLDIKVSDKVG